MKQNALYLQVAEAIRQQFIDGQTLGVRLPTQKELQELFSVSSITIRAALSHLGRQGFLHLRQGSGAFVAQPVKIDKHVALLMEGDIADPRFSPVYPRTLQATRLALFGRGIPSRPYLGFSPELQIAGLMYHDLMEDLQHGRISAVISLLSRKPRPWINELRRQSIPFLGTPTTAVHGAPATADYNISIDRAKRAKELLVGLSRRERRKLCVISTRISSESENSFSGYLSMLAPEYGFEVEKFLPPEDADINPDCWRPLFLKLSDPATRPDVVFVAEDTFFIQAQAVMRSLGFPWEEEMEVLLFGSDGVDLPIEIPLTRLTFSIEEKADKLAAVVEDVFEGKEMPSFVEISLKTEVYPGRPVEKESPVRRKATLGSRA